MVWPLVGMAAASLAGGLINMWATSEEAEAMKEAARLGDEQAAKQLEVMNQIIAKVESGWQNPQFAATQLSPEEIQYLGDYAPSMVQYIQEANPELIQGLNAKAERASQLQALGELSGQMRPQNVNVADTVRGQMDLAQSQAAAAESSQRATILRDLASKGLLESGQAAGFAMDAAQQQMAGLRQAGTQAALAQAQMQTQAEQAEQQRRMNAIQALGSMATNVRGQQLNIEGQNVSAINAFNQRASQTKQMLEQQNVAARNAAALRNLNTQQDIQGQNVGARNRAEEFNISRGDRNAVTEAEMANRKLQTLADMQSGVVRQQLGQTAATTAREIEDAKGSSAGVHTVGDIVSKVPGMVKDVRDYQKGEVELETAEEKLKRLKAGQGV